MKVTKIIKVRYVASDGHRFLEMGFTKNKCTKFDSNLPYEKDIEDWIFLAKAVKKIISLL